MTSRQLTHQAVSAAATNTHSLIQRRPLAVNTPGDRFEREADRVADAVVSGRRQAGQFSLSAVPITRVQREEHAEKKTDEEKYQEAAGKLGEAFLETAVGKKLLEKVKQDPLVKGANEAGESFIGTLPGKIITGAAAAGAVATLAATHKALPAQIPEIPLDVMTPGLKVKITYEGPVDKPTEAMITFKFTEQAPRGSGERETRPDPGGKTARRKCRRGRRPSQIPGRFEVSAGLTGGFAAEGCGRGRQKRPGKGRAGPGPGCDGEEVPVIGRAATKSGLQLTPPTPSFGFKPPSLFGDEYRLKLPGEQKKKDDEPVLQRKAAGDSDRRRRAAGGPCGAQYAWPASGRRHPRLHGGALRPRFRPGARPHRCAGGRVGAGGQRGGVHGGDGYCVCAGAICAGVRRSRHLLAHELAHVVQQNSGPVTSPQVQRLGVWESIGVFFGLTEGDFGDEELQAHLDKLETKGRIEGDYDSDNKASRDRAAGQVGAVEVRSDTQDKETPDS